MGKLDSSMGFSVNEDGSITRTNCSLHNSQTPDFIPVSLSKFKGGFWKKVLYFLYFLLILGVHGAIVGFGIVTISYNNRANYYYNQYQERSIAFQNKDLSNEDYKNFCENGYDWYTPEDSLNDYNWAKRERFTYFIPFIIALCLGIFIDWKIVPKVIRNYPNKKRILKGADYIQANLSYNYGFPYIMTNNYIGVLNTHKKKIIISPDYDVIYWVIPQNVLCAVRNDKHTFYDVNGKILTNVPSSYLNR